MNEVLKEKELTLKVSNDDEKSILIQETQNNNIKKDENTLTRKAKKVAFKTLGAFIDSFAKNFLKKKYKINYSVYNDGKKAVQAIKNKDRKTFYKKASDAVLNLIKKLPASTRKIIKDTKNGAIDEICS